MSLVRAHVLCFDFDGSVGAGLYGRYGVGEQSHCGPVASLASFTSSCVQLLSSNSGVNCPSNCTSPLHRLLEAYYMHASSLISFIFLASYFSSYRSLSLSL